MGRVVGANCGLVELWFVFRKQVVITKKKEERMKQTAEMSTDNNHRANDTAMTPLLLL